VCRRCGEGLTAAQHGLVLLASFALVALFTYPLVLDPGHLLPAHKDPLMYGWTMVSNVRRLLSVPLAVFHGNTFYPNGNSVAYTDLLLTPTLFPAGLVYLLTGNPVLQYNVTLLVWWALSAWAMYVLAYHLLRSHAGAALAAIVFALCPFRTDFYLEFQMELAFPIPLAFWCLWRYLEGRRWKPVLGMVGFLWVEALASMYYAIILGMCLAVVASLHVLLRPRTWGWRPIAQVAVAGAVLGLALAPFIVPYAQNYRELHLERSRHQLQNYYADVMTYFETGPTRLYHFGPTGHTAETSLFLGFVPLALAAWACVRREDRPTAHGEERSWRRAIRRTLTFAILLTIALLIVRLASIRLGAVAEPHPSLPPQAFLDVLLALGLIRIVLEGWWAARTGDGHSPLTTRELRWICLLLIVLFFDLSLGSYVQYRREVVGRGLYFYLYPYLIPLHAMRVTSRIGVIVVFSVALLAGLGLAQLIRSLSGRWARASVGALAAGLTLVEYAPFPLPYAPFPWEDPPPVYRTLAADPDDIAVLEWPQGDEDWDDYFTFQSINHWKRLTNGASGFLPAMTQDIWYWLSRPDDPLDPFPTPPALRYLQGIHPLRYLVVHNDLLDEREQAKWRKLGAQPWATLVRRYGSDDLYQLSGDATGGRIDKFFSWDYARTRRAIAFDVRPIGPRGRRHWVVVELNDRPLGRVEVGEAWTPVRLPLTRPLFHSAPNVLSIYWRYDRRAAGSPPLIGRTGVRSPSDLNVSSGGALHGDVASIMVNGIERARDSRGYNVVALDPTSGAVVWSEVFDTYASRADSQRMADQLGRLPAGTVVAVAVRDEASTALGEEGVAALRSIGAAEDIRGRYRVSHLIVGVTGAPSGSAVERVGDARLDVDLGPPRGEAAMAIRGFRLE
jgi:hypothetical protein